MTPIRCLLTIGVVGESGGVDLKFACDDILGKGILVEKNAEASGHARTNSRGGIFSPLGSWQSPLAHKLDAVQFLEHDQHGKQHGWEIDAAFHTFARRLSSWKRKVLSTNEIAAESPPQNSHSWGIRETTLTPSSNRAILTRSEKFGSATYPPGRPGCQRTPAGSSSQGSEPGEIETPLTRENGTLSPTVDNLVGEIRNAH